MKKKCKGCPKSFEGHPLKKFCSQKCKDRYHNTVNPRGYGAVKKTYDDGSSTCLPKNHYCLDGAIRIDNLKDY